MTSEGMSGPAAAGPVDVPVYPSKEDEPFPPLFCRV